LRKDPGNPKDGFLGKVGIPGDAVLKMCIRLAITKAKIGFVVKVCHDRKISGIDRLFCMPVRAFWLVKWWLSPVLRLG